MIFVVKHFWSSANWESIQDLCFGILKFATDLQNPSDIEDNNIQAVLKESESWSGLENYFSTKNKEFLLTTEEARCCKIVLSITDEVCFIITYTNNGRGWLLYDFFQ